ncbi:MAG: hypothetical protein L0212_02045 [Acidobacteria bacterium]|nr:hypothetical protein [Acidobacteriota bacterium]
MTEQVEDGSSSNRILTLDITLAELNPNHKYRLALFGLDSRWLADLSFVKRDESIYLMPLIDREYTLDLPDSLGQRIQHQVLPNSGFHISLHASETINITVGGRRVGSRTKN